MFRRSVALCLVTSASIAPFAQTAFAEPCFSPPALPLNRAHYVAGLVDALGHAQSATAQFDSLRDDRNDFGTALGVMLALRRAQSDYECAAATVAPYETSDIKAIAVSAKAAATAFTLLAHLQERSQSELRQLLDAESAGELAIGTRAEIQADIADKADKAMELLYLAAIAGTQAAVVADPKTGKMSRLALTRSERESLIAELVSTFGDKVKDGPRSGQSYVLAAGAVLYQLLGSPEYAVQNE